MVEDWKKVINWHEQEVRRQAALDAAAAPERRRQLVGFALLLLVFGGIAIALMGIAHGLFCVVLIACALMVAGNF